MTQEKSGAWGLYLRNLSSRYMYCLCWLLSNETAGSNSAFFIATPVGIFFIIPISFLDCLSDMI